MRVDGTCMAVHLTKGEKNGLIIDRPMMKRMTLASVSCRALLSARSFTWELECHLKGRWQVLQLRSARIVVGRQMLIVVDYLE